MKQARIAGFLYVMMAVLAVFSLEYVPSVFFVRGDATGTMSRIAAAPTLYRLGIAADLAGQIGFVFVVLALYRLLADVDKRQAQLMVTLVIVSVPLSFFNTMSMSAPLVLSSGAGFLAAFDKQQLDALAMVSLRLRGIGIDAVTALWGLWLIPFGLLVIRSRFLPAVIGSLLIVGGVSNLLISFTSLVFPIGSAVMNRWMMIPASAGEVAIMFWLLARGAREEVMST
jgi:hypothetical protein